MIKKYLSLWIALLTSALFLFSTASFAQVSWRQWVQQLRQEAVDSGISAHLFDQIFSQIKQPSRKVLHYDRTQPEKRISFLKYRNTRADAYRIKIGRRELQKNKTLLNEIGRYYGVSPCFIVSFWGLETSYGRFMGNFPVVKSLATLAYDSRRGAFFRKQLMYALHIVNDGHVSYKNFKGEWAGASGQPQFLPSSWYHYAVDYNQDGKKDIWTTRSDVFASIANYLIQHGWRSGQPWAVPVKVPSQARRYENTDTRMTVNDWYHLGLKAVNGRGWPDGALEAKLIRPDGGPNMLVFNNFNVIMKWNRSTYYAGTVGYMAESICGRPL
jgi:membrane-bound lytic murein transglycosylase B